MTIAVYWDVKQQQTQFDNSYFTYKIHQTCPILKDHHSRLIPIISTCLSTQSGTISFYTDILRAAMFCNVDISSKGSMNGI